jgi:GAF domain-containing protein
MLAVLRHLVQQFANLVAVQDAAAMLYQQKKEAS